VGLDDAETIPATPASPSPPFRAPPSEPFDECHCASCLSQPSYPHISLLALSPVIAFHSATSFIHSTGEDLSSSAAAHRFPFLLSWFHHRSEFRACSLTPPVSLYQFCFLYSTLLEFPSCVSRPCPPAIIRLCVSFSMWFLDLCPALLSSRRSCALPYLSSVTPYTSISLYDYSYI